MTGIDIRPLTDDDLGMDIINLILNDERINPAFRASVAASMSEPEKAGYAAKRDYLDRCAAAGEEPDAVMADRVYWKAHEQALFNHHR